MLCKSSKKTTKNDEDLAEYTKYFNKTIKLLLLGTGESGKTTIIKQMKILHINGFSNEERKEKIPQIKQNIHESIYDIIYNMNKIDPPVKLNTEENQASVEFILNLGPNELTEYSDEYFDHVNKLWADSGVQETYHRSNEYQLIDSAAHFLNRIEVIRKDAYIPSTLDILFCRVKTVAISKIEFSVLVPKKYGGGSVDFLMYDVGGQRGERKKWIQVFEGIDAILFLIAASDFDQTLREDSDKNRLEESFSLFKDIYGSRFLRNAGLIIFLNKQDLLKNKIDQGRKIQQYFPEYENYQPKMKDWANDEYEKAKFWMEDKIIGISKIPLTAEHTGFIPGKNIHEILEPREVYTHFTIATDTDNIKKVFNSVHEIVLKKMFKSVLY